LFESDCVFDRFSAQNITNMVNDTKKPQSWLPSFFGTPKSSKATDAPDERTSLLPPTPSEEDIAGETYELEEGTASTIQLVSQEFWVLLRGSLPVILAYALQNSLQTVSVLIVGRLSPEALATAAFSYMFAMATGWLIALGGTTAIDTLASASFTGSKNRHDLGIILQRSFIVLLLFYIPVAILWFCSEPLFRALGQEEYIARDSARFLSVLAPGGIGYIFFEALKKYLQAQGIYIL
jgi:MATE family multidrug resistance protein